MKSPLIPIYFTGLILSIVILFAVGWVADLGFNIMGQYVKKVIPIGAIMVGVAAGCGYAWLARSRGVKLPKTFLWLIFLTGIAHYYGAQYASYLAVRMEMGAGGGYASFGDYLQILCETSTLKEGIGEAAKAEVLGKTGYLYHGLEVLGYGLGVVSLSLALRGQGYCPGCARFMDKPVRRSCGSALSTAQLKKLPKPQRRVRTQELLQEMLAAAERVATDFRAGNPDRPLALASCMTEHADLRCAGILHIDVEKCTGCARFRVTIRTMIVDPFSRLNNIGYTLKHTEVIEHRCDGPGRSAQLSVCIIPCHQ